MGPPLNLTDRNRAPFAAIDTVITIVPKNEDLIGSNHNRSVVPPKGGEGCDEMNIWLTNWLSISKQGRIAQFDSVAGNADNALDLLCAVSVVQIQHHDLAVSRRVVMIPPGIYQKEIVPFNRR